MGSKIQSRIRAIRREIKQLEEERIKLDAATRMLEASKKKYLAVKTSISGSGDGPDRFELIELD